MAHVFSDGLVSIVTPVYNAERFLQATIDSVLGQTYTQFEYILVNDCSSDSSRAILDAAAVRDDRVKVIHLVENSGAAVARNAGIEAAKGEYIAFVDSDDVWAESKLAKQIAYMTESGSAFTYTGFALIDEAGRVIKEAVDLPTQLDYDGLLRNTAIACSTVVIDRNVAGDFRMPNVRKGQDTATWLMLMRERDLVADGINEVLNYYRQVEGSISSNKIGALKRTWHTYYRLEKLPLPKALYYFTNYVFNAVKRRI